MADTGIDEGVSSLARRIGLSSDAVAVLMVVAGILVLVFESLLRVILGAVLIAVGVTFLYQSSLARKAAAESPRE